MLPPEPYVYPMIPQIPTNSKLDLQALLPSREFSPFDTTRAECHSELGQRNVGPFPEFNL
jgi:hypothetical protein